MLARAEKMGGLYGSEASKAGLSLAETVEAFLFFRSPVLFKSHAWGRAVTDGEIMVCVRDTRWAPSTAARSTCRLGGR